MSFWNWFRFKKPDLPESLKVTPVNYGKPYDCYDISLSVELFVLEEGNKDLKYNQIIKACIESYTGPAEQEAFNVISWLLAGSTLNVKSNSRKRLQTTGRVKFKYQTCNNSLRSRFQYNRTVPIFLRGWKFLLTVEFNGHPCEDGNDISATLKDKLDQLEDFRTSSIGFNARGKLMLY
ncbi:matrix protein [Sunguru virus]|uniref:Matrix protein n=1 Tax=Sunguru virus TaxID=1491491 RepID=A0A023T3Q1_9RHAB|nr:matrix protein [Sunguru virus]AHX81841.1 matrix protein [Sunguru virus]